MPRVANPALTMEAAAACRDKKFQSSWKLSAATDEPVGRDGAVNPYNRPLRASGMCPKWLLPNADDNESGVVSGLPQLECAMFASSYVGACTCCPRDPAGKARSRGCCREEWARRELYRKIKEKVENAVKVTFAELELPLGVFANLFPLARKQEFAHVVARVKKGEEKKKERKEEESKHN